MAAVIMSNPGLHMAVLGNPGPQRKKRKGKKTMATRKQLAALRKARAAKKRKYKSVTRAKSGRGVKVVYRRKAGKRKTNRKFGRKRGIRTGNRGTVAFRVAGRTVATNPKRRRSRKGRSMRRNPISLKGYTGGFTSAPSQIMKTFTGRNKVKGIGYLAAGTVAAYLAGGFTAKFINPFLARVPFMQKAIVQRVVGASMNYTAGYLISNFIKDANLKTAIRLGGALAAIAEFAMPGKLGQYVSRIPFIGGRGAPAIVAEAATGPVEGLAAYHGTELAGFMGEYVDAAAYQGAGEYVDASAYQGAGEYVDASAYQGAGDNTALAEYVDASAYQGAGDNNALAGSYLDEADMFKSYL